MKPVAEIRRTNLNSLVAEAGSQVAVAKKIGKDKNQIHQWLLDPGAPGARNIGPRSARELEAAFGKPPGWLDHENEKNLKNGETTPVVDLDQPPPPAPTEKSSQPVELDPDMVAETHKALRLYYRRRGKEYDIERQPEEFIWAYGLRLALGDEPTSADLIDFGAKLADRARKRAEAERGDERRDGSKVVGGD